jgi:hypothetical protein
MLALVPFIEKRNAGLSAAIAEKGVDTHQEAAGRERVSVGEEIRLNSL